MRISMIVYYYWPRLAGGAERQCRILSHKLAEYGLQVSVITARYESGVPPKDRDGNIDIVRLPIFDSWVKRFGGALRQQKSQDRSEHTEGHDGLDLTRDAWSSPIRSSFAKGAACIVRYLNSSIFFFALLVYLKKNRPSIDILHVHTADWIAGAAALGGKIFNIKVLCKGANIPVFPELKGVPLPRLMNRWRKTPYFIALTEAMVEDLGAQGVGKDKISLIPNGVVIPDQKAAPYRHETFLFLGNFSQTAAHKGFDILIDAWSKVVEQEPEARLIMAGGGDSSQWQNLAKEMGIGETIAFPGYCTDTEMLWLQVGCLVLPSRKEGMSNALLEANSYGLPAIVSDVPGVREVVVDEETGIIVPIADSRALYEAILKMLRNPDLRRSYGDAALTRVSTHFSIEAVANQVQSLYKRLIH